MAVANDPIADARAAYARRHRRPIEIDLAFPQLFASLVAVEEWFCFHAEAHLTALLQAHHSGKPADPYVWAPPPAWVTRGIKLLSEMVEANDDRRIRIFGEPDTRAQLRYYASNLALPNPFPFERARIIVGFHAWQSLVGWSTNRGMTAAFVAELARQLRRFRAHADRSDRALVGDAVLEVATLPERLKHGPGRPKDIVLDWFVSGAIEGLAYVGEKARLADVADLWQVTTADAKTSRLQMQQRLKKVLARARVEKRHAADRASALIADTTRDDAKSAPKNSESDAPSADASFREATSPRTERQETTPNGVASLRPKRASAGSRGASPSAGSTGRVWSSSPPPAPPRTSGTPTARASSSARPSGTPPLSARRRG